MADKDIVLRINAITNKEVMEEFGSVLNDVLGSYEDNVQLLVEYNSQIKAVKAQIKALNKIEEQRGKLNEQQKQQLAQLTAQEGDLRQASAQLQQVIKNEEKIRMTANGTMQNQAQLLSKLRMAWRQMTDEQKAANPQILAVIQALDKHIKDADASIGNFQRNVGNYPQLMQQILPVQGQVGNGLMQIAQSMGATTGALGVLGGALAAGAVAYAGFQQAMELTQTVGDEVAIKVAGWEAVYDKFIRMIVSADFSNFIDQLRNAKHAAEDMTAALDELFERNNALTIAEAKASVEQQRNLMIMRDQTKTLKERKEAGEAYMASVMELANVRKDIAEQEFGAKLTNFAAQTGLSEEDVKFYIENYDKYREKANEIADAKKNNLSKLGELFESLTADEKRFYQISSKYTNANDELTADLVQAWAKVEGAIANALQSSQRAATTVNSLTAQEQRKDNKTKKDKSGSVVLPVRIDTVSAMDDLNVFAEEIDEAMTMAVNSGAIKPITVKTEEVSPLAKMLGVSDEQLTTIKDKALQAAQQIYGSIQQMSQQATQRRLEDELAAIESEAESEKAILEGKLEKNLISQKRYEKELAELDAQTEQRKEAAKKEAFEKEKRWNIASALMNAALALTKLFTEATVINPATWIAAAITTATTAAQVATIASQKYARGGELSGGSHAQGGIKGSIQGHPIELEGGEVVINKRSATKYRSALSYINSDNGWGVDFAGVRNAASGYSPRFRFAQGGVLGSYDFSPAATPQSTTVQQVIAQQASRTEEWIKATNRRIDRLQVYVELSHIQSKADEKQTHVSRANL